MEDRYYRPSHADVADERRERKQHLAAAVRLFGALSFDQGLAGHLTVRDPEHPELYWVNPFGLHFRQLRVRDLLLCDRDGNVVEGDRPVNRAAFVIHSHIHAARPDVVAAAHAHSPHGVAFSTLGRLLDPISQDACAFYEDHVILAEYGGVVTADEEAKRLVHALGSAKALILANHGLLTVGESIDEAAWWYVSMERACQVQLAAEAAGTPGLIAMDTARATRDQVGAARIGRRSFETLYNWLVDVEPELLDEG